LVRGYGSPSAEYSIGTVEVSNGDYSVFLNDLGNQGLLTIADGWIVSSAPAFYPGHRLLLLTGNTGLQKVGNLFSPIPGKAGHPVTMVTWYGADAFGNWLTQQSMDWAFRLPTEWEWEAAAGTGYVGASSQLSAIYTANQNGVGDSLPDESTLWWGLAGMVSTVAEWTNSEALGMTGLMTVRGGAGNWYSGARDAASRVEFLDAGSAASHIGFRLVRITREVWKTVSSDRTWTAAIDSGVLTEGGVGTLVLTRSGDPSFEYVLSVSCSDPRIGLPQSVSFAPGESVRLVNFNVAADSNAAAARGARVTIESENLSVATLDVMILDQAVPELSVTYGSDGLQSGKGVTIRFNRNGDVTRPLTLRLSGSAVSALGLPGTMVIPAGSAFANQDLILPVVNGATTYGLDLGADWYRKKSALLEILPRSGTAFDSWVLNAGLSGANSARNATPRNDGITNILKFAFNLNPNAPDVRKLVPGAGNSAGLPCGFVSTASDRKALVIEYIRRKASSNPGVTYTVEFSSDLKIWTPASLPETVVSIDDTWESVVVMDNPPIGSSSRMGRVKIE
jgi:hypothetical protein